MNGEESYHRRRRLFALNSSRWKHSWGLSRAMVSRIKTRKIYLSLRSCCSLKTAERLFGIEERPRDGRSLREEGSSLDSSKDRHVNPIPLEARRAGRVSYNKMHVLRILSAARSHSSRLYFRARRCFFCSFLSEENRSGSN